jgi:hypothetical protein
MRDLQLFNKAVETFFGLIARELGLPLSKVQDGVYDIPSQYFIMRIRLHTGHRRGLNVLLRPASLRECDENKTGNELGIACFIEFNDENPQATFIDVSTDENFLEQARLLAKTAERYGVPYLRGEGKDWEAIKEMITRKTAQSVAEIRKLQFPKNVREEWIPPTNEGG